MVEFDDKLILKEAESLYKKARSIAISYAFIFFVIGFVVGYIATSANPTFSFGIGLCGLLLGFAAGSSAGQKLKFNAQMLLCQLQIERNTRK